MRIYIYTTETHSRRTHCQQMMEMTARMMPQFGHQATADYPDVVHLWGRWDSRSAAEIRRWQKVFTPVVFSSIEGLTELCDNMSGVAWVRKRHQMRTICRLTDEVMVQGNEESLIVEQYGRKSPVTVLNPIVTSLTSEGECVQQMAKLYADLYTSHDEKIKKVAEAKAHTVTSNESVAHIVEHILYTQYLFRHGTCYDTDVMSLARQIIETETDEDALAVALNSIDLMPFTRRMMAIMVSREMITEGFMPVEELTDKHTRRLDKAIKMH